ncbi:MAG TPA: hypothetical protein VFA03_06520 [Acetobacteraceae bacterium]|nr:hypothetical protein [Acetobacteraceae bacterium]
MSRIGTTVRQKLSAENRRFRTAVREPMIFVIEDSPIWAEAMEQLCDYLDVRLTRITPDCDLRAALRDQRPMAVLAEMEGAAQDGCYVLQVIGAHDPDLPVMVRTGRDEAMIGAGQAVQQIWRLSAVQFVEAVPTAAEMMDFLCRAGQRGGCLGLVPS